MGKKSAKQVTNFLGTSALTRPLFVLGAASMMFGSGSANALDSNTLPQNPNVVGGKDTFSQSGSTLNVNQSTNRTIIDWRSFDIGSKAQVNFAQPGTSSIAVNRINGSTNPTDIEGGLHANGQVWILNPNGVFFGKTSRVDAAGIVATTANINDKAFMAGSNSLQMTGTDHGFVSNAGNITVGANGLAAFVAPSVRNSGTINATVGRVSLAAGTTYTLDLAGDHLVELGLGSVKAIVDNSGRIVNPGGTITLTAKAAGQVVNSVVNVSGVVSASSATKSGGTVILGGDTINTTKTASITADAGANGTGGTITSVANVQGNYAGTFSAKGGSKTGDGGKIETSGANVHVDGSTKVNTLAAHGKTGLWVIDPNTLTVVNGTGTTNSTIGADTVEANLNTTSFSLSANNTINVNATIDTSSQTNSNTLNFADANADGALTVNLRADILLGASQHLTGDANIVNLFAGDLIQNGIDVASTLGATVHVGAGTYAAGSGIQIDKSNISLVGASGAEIDVDPGASGTVNAITIGGSTNDVTVSGLDIRGEVTGSYLTYAWGSAVSRGIAVLNGATNVTITNNDIRNVRNGILIDGRNTGNVTNNVIDNTKSAISVQYTDAGLGNTEGYAMTMTGNSQSTYGNEWGVNFHLNGHYVGATYYNNSQKIASNATTAVQQALLAFSAANNGMTAQDQGYSYSNRTAVTVSTTGSDSNQGSPLSNLATIQAGINAVVSGGTVNVLDGTYTISSGYINVNKSLDLIGESESGVIIDARNASTYGLRVTATDGSVDLENFTLYGVTSGASNGGYGLKAEATNGLTLAHITSEGAYKSEFDLNGVVNGSLSYLDANGYSVGTTTQTGGNGISFTNSQNITLTHSTTENNAWGGLALYQGTTYGNLQLTGITVNSTNTFNETNGIYAQDQSSVTDIGTINLSGQGIHYIAQDLTGNSDGVYTYFQKTKAGALSLAENSETLSGASVQGYAGTNLNGNNIFYVSTDGTHTMSIQAAINAAAASATINVDAGTYTDALNISKNVDIEGAGKTKTFIQPTTLLTTGVGHKYDSNVETAVYVHDASNVTINGVTIDANNLGANAVVFWNNASGSITNSLIENPMAFNGLQTGQDLAVDATGSNTSNLTVSGVTFQNWNKNAIDAVTGDGTGANGGNIILAVDNSTFTGRGATGTNAQNGIVLWEAGGGTVTGTIDHDTFSNLSYNDTANATAAAVLLYGSPNGTLTVSNSTFASSVQEYISVAGGSPHEVDATNNNSFGGVVAKSTDTLSQLYTIENKLIDSQDDSSNGMIRLVAGEVYVTAVKDNIQGGVDGASSGDTVNIQAGTYTGQVIITKDLDILGAGAGQTIIDATDSMAHSFTGNGNPYHAVVSIEGANVSISDLTVDGLGKGNTNNRFLGIGFHNANGTVTNVDITGVRNGPLDGVQSGTGLEAFNDDGVSRSITLTDSTIEDFQKNAVAFVGANLTVDVENNTFTGAGSTGAIAQNGVEFFGAGGTVSGTIANNTIQDIGYANTDNSSSDILLWNAGNTTVTGNTLIGTGAGGSSNGLFVSGTGTVTANANNISNFGWGVTVDNEAGTGGHLNLQNNVITGNGVTVDLGFNETDNSVVNATNNNLAGNSSGIELESSSDTANFSGNWWGTTDAAAIEASMTGADAGLVDFSPFLMSGTDTSVAAGFQGGFANLTVTALGGGDAARIQEGVADVTAGGTVNVTDGNYTLAGELDINKSLTLIGAGAATNITSLSTGYGIYVTGNDVSLQNFTYNGPTAAGSTYGIKVEPGTNVASDRLTGFDIENVTIDGGYRTGLDLNGVDGATIKNVSVSNIVHGNGIALTDSANVTITGSTTTNNAWGGLALYQTNTYYNQQLNNISIDGTNTFNEANGVYEEDQSSLWDMGSNVTIAGYNFADIDKSVSNDQYTFFQKTQQGAIDFATNATANSGHLSLANTYVEGWTGNALNNLFYVGYNTADTKALTIGAAVNAATTGGTVNVGSGTYAEAVSAGKQLEFDFGDVTVNSFALTSGAAGSTLNGDLTATGSLSSTDSVTLNGDFVAASIALNGAVTLTGDTTLDTSAAHGGITVASVTGAGNDLTINAGTGNTSLGNVTGAGALTVDGKSTLTGTSYTADSEAFDGAVTLTGDTTLDTSTAGGDITVASVTGAGNDLTIDAGTGNTSLGNVTGAGALTVDGKSTLTGTSYTAASEEFDGAVTLTQALTTLDTHTANGGITLASVDGTSIGAQNLTLKSGSGTVSLGDVGDSFALGTLIDSNATNLTGTSYKAGNITLGATTLQHGTTIDTSAAGGPVSIASVTGATNDLTIDTGSGITTLGNVTGVGALLVDDAVTLNGTSYVANSETFDGAVTLNKNVTLNTSTAGGAISVASVTGAGKNLTINAGAGNTTLGNVANGGALTVDGTVTLNGTSYVATGEAFLGAVTLTGDTTLDTSATGGNISVASVTGATNDLTIDTGTGTASLGNVAGVGALQVDDAAKLTGNSYMAASEDFVGAVTLTGDTTLDTTSDDGDITLASVDGTTMGGQSLTLLAGAGAVSLGDVGDTKRLNILTDNNTTTLTGGSYKANSVSLGDTTLEQATTVTTFAGGDITVASVTGAGNDLTLNATGNTSLGDVSGVNALQVDGTATLTGTSYVAASEAFDGAVTLSGGDTTLDTSTAGGDISVASVIGGGNSLTIDTGAAGFTTLGNVSDVNALTVDDAVTLTGNSYVANSEEFDGEVTLTQNTTTLDTSAAGGGITVASVDGNGVGTQNLTITTGGGDVTLGSAGSSATLGKLVDNNATTLTGTTYNASAITLGATTLNDDATLNTSAAHGNVSVASVTGNDHDFEIDAGTGNTSLGDVTGAGALTVDGKSTLTGTSYTAASEDFAGAVKLTQSLTTLDTSGDNGDITLASVDGTTPGNQSLTVTAGSGMVTLGSTGVNKRLGTLLDSNATTLTGTAYNANAITLGATTLNDSATVTTFAGGDITVASVTGAGNDLTLDAAGNTSLGNVLDAGALKVDGTSTLTGTSYTAASEEFDGAVTLSGGDTTLDTSAAGGDISVASVIGGTNSLTIDTGAAGFTTLGNVSAVNALTVDDAVTLTGNSYVANSEEFDGEVTLTQNTTTLNTSGNNGDITIASVDGTAAGAQNLTITAGTGTVSLGNTGNSITLGKLVDSNTTTLTGSAYDASAITLGDTTLTADTTLDTTFDSGNVTVGAVTANGHSLTINGGTTDLGVVTGASDLDVAGAVTLEGGDYTAGSIEFGAVTLTQSLTTLDTTSDDGDITLASVDGTTAGGQSLTLLAGAGAVSLGDVGDAKRLNILTDNNDTTLTGGSYKANSVSLGDTTLEQATTVTTFAGGDITVASVTGAGNDLTLDAAGNTSLGNVLDAGALKVDGTSTLTGTSYTAASEEFDGAVTLSGGDTTLDTSTAGGDISVASVIGGGNSLTIDTGAAGFTTLGNVSAVNALTVDDAVTLTGNSYVANSEEFDGEVTLTQNTTTLNTSGNNGDITIASVDGTAAGAQNLTITAGTGTVSLGNTGNSITLGKLVDSNTTTLTGSAYDASAITLGDTTLDNADVTLSTSVAHGNVSVASVIGSGDSLEINAGTGNTRLGNVTGAGALTVDGKATLTGTSYTAASEDFVGAVTLTGDTTLDTTSDDGDITLASVDGTTMGGQSLTLLAGAGAVSLGDVGDTKRLNILTDNNTTTLTGGSYKANSVSLGDTTLEQATTVTTFAGGDITVASVTGAGNDLTLNATGNTSLGDVSGVNALQVDGTATLTGTSYVAASEAFDGAVTLSGGDTTLDTSTAGGDISVASVIGGGNSLTIDTGAAGFTTLGNVSDVNALTVDDAVTLTGNSYVANSEEFDGEVTLTKATTLDTSAAGGAISVASVTGAGKNLTINAGTGNTTLGSVTGAGALTVDGTATLSGTDYTATSEAFDGAVALDADVTLDTSVTGGNISVASVTGAGNDLTIDTGAGLTSLGNVAGVGALQVDDAAKLTGNSYVAASEDFAGAVKLTTDTTLDTSAHNGAITLASVDGTTTGGQSLTLLAGAGAVSLGDVGDAKRLNILTDNNDTTLTGGSYKANSVSLGDTTLEQATTVTTFAGGDITVASVTGAGNDLTLDAAGNTSLGNVLDAGALKVDGTSTLTGTSYTAASEEFDGAVTLANDVTLDTSAANGTITVASVTGNAHDLTIDAGTGNTSLGDVSNAGALKVDGTSTLTGTSYTAASEEFDGTVTLTGDTTLDTSTAGGDITVASVTGAGNDLTIDAGTGNTSLGSVSNAGALKVDGTSTLTGTDYTATSEEFDGAVTLANDVTLDTRTAGGSITVASVIGDDNNLTVDAGTGPISLGNVSGADRLLVTGDATLTDDSYAGDVLDFFGNVTLTKDTSLDSDNGTIDVVSVIGGGNDLTIDAGTGGSVLLGNVANAGALLVSSPVTLTGGTYVAASEEFDGPVTLTIDTTLDTSAANGDITVASVTGAGNDLTIDAGSGNTTLGNVSNAGALLLDGTSTLTGTDYTAASEEFDGAVTLANDVTLDTSAANGDITLASVSGNAHDLTIDDGTGTALLGDVTGAGSLDVNGAVTLTGSLYTAGSMDFAGELTLTNSTVLDTSSDDGDITVSSVDGTTAGGQSLTVDAGTGTVSLGNAGATTRLGTLLDDSATTLTGTTYAANALDFAGAVTLGNNVTLNTSAHNGAIVLASVDGTTAGGQSLTINAGTGTVSLGNVGATTRVGALTDDSNTTLTGTTYDANSLDFVGALTLTKNTTLDTSAHNGAITLASVNGASAGAQSLTLNAGSGLVSMGNLGATTRLGAVTDDSNTKLTGSTYKANSFLFGGNVTLTAATTTLNTTQSASKAGDITFNGDIFGTTNGGQSLTLVAGPGTGAASANGNITLQNAGTSSARLGNMTVSGNNFTALTVWLAGNFGSTLTGNQAFAADTLNAGGNVTSNVGGNATGHIDATGDVLINAGGDIAGTIDGQNVTLNGDDVDATVTAVQAATVQANTIEGSYNGNTVSLTAFGSVNANVNSTTTFNLVTPTGSVNGTWVSIDTNGSGSIDLNGQQTLGQDSLNPNQLVVEGFTLPAGTTIGANGQLILPQGVLLGLLSPGGGKPKMILVHSVQQLGLLLAEGYTVIVIDLSHRGENEVQLASN